MIVLNDRRQTMRGDSRRRTPRWWATRNVQIHVSRPTHHTDASKGPLILMGHTYDLSATGLSVYLPALDCDIQDLFEGSGALDVVLSITPREVKVKAAPIHCETIVPGMPGKSACIGMRIDQEDGGYPTYLEYLREFQGQHKDA